MGAQNHARDDAFDTKAAPLPTAEELLAATTPPARGRSAHAAPDASASLDAEPEGARALRAAADAEPGVRSRSCLIRTEDDGRPVVTLSIAVAYGRPLHEVADRVRARVTKAAGRALHTRKKPTVDVKVVWLDD
ncbi:hypothetical protein [Yinghuangia seranimata]|uniref:hypothetical protein n=1 Tax=Yinghuangia seranimata TaxID=408067 RepID=UPI00248B68F4|nr:hypothetical protein [Yinghuangia seranimata]MDI2126336.1 hypothetical protein [Yinghuangia seranimata]